MIVAGVMSGTSADGINVALVRIGERGRGRPRHTILAHAEYSFPAAVRRAILGMMNAESARVADLSRLNFLLGELYADIAVRHARAVNNPDFIGMIMAAIFFKTAHGLIRMGDTEQAFLNRIAKLAYVGSLS